MAAPGHGAGKLQGHPSPQPDLTVTPSVSPPGHAAWASLAIRETGVWISHTPLGEKEASQFHRPFPQRDFKTPTSLHPRSQGPGVAPGTVGRWVGNTKCYPVSQMPKPIY